VGKHSVAYAVDDIELMTKAIRLELAVDSLVDGGSISATFAPAVEYSLSTDAGPLGSAVALWVEFLNSRA
jgi:hypothetical protein